MYAEMAEFCAIGAVSLTSDPCKSFSKLWASRRYYVNSLKHSIVANTSCACAAGKAVNYTKTVGVTGETDISLKWRYSTHLALFSLDHAV